MEIQIASNKLKEALASYAGDATARQKVEYSVKHGNTIGFNGATQVRFNLKTVPQDFLKHLLEVGDLTDRQRVAVHTMASGGASADIDMECSKPSEVHTMITSLKVSGDYNAELMLNGRWYPVRLESRYSTGQTGSYGEREGATTTISTSLKMVDAGVGPSWSINKHFFLDDQDEPITRTGKEILSMLGLRHLQQDLSAYEKKVDKAAQMNSHSGRLQACVGSVLAVDNGYGRGMTAIDLGSTEIPKKVVIESELETQGNRQYGQGQDKILALPFVRVFALDLKRYVYADVEDITAYEFDKEAIKNLVLPPREKGVITKLFSADVSKLFGDVLKDKHGGMIILANGSSGVGKTLTAEVFAEMTERPLYVMEMCELGIEVKSMEQNLERVFKRVTKWNAVLLMDEADVFLAKRGEDLERSVIVGIFLRLMDYYKGLLFLTSNRSEVIDPAFKSRITIKFDYPNLTEEARREIWTIMLDKAGIEVEGGLDGIPAVELNGRQIRNMVRLLKTLHGPKVTAEQVKEVCQFACK